MNAMLQRHCAKYIYIVPDGLRELMSDISREVIRSQPCEIYKFIADYLDALMITRENARIALRLVQSITEIAETTVDLLVRTGLDRDEANKIATIIQINFREYLSKKHSKGPPETEEDKQKILEDIMAQLEVNEEKLTEVAEVIQTAYRSFKERQKREKDMLFGMVDWRIAAKSAIALYRRTGVTMYEANRAATLIKAAYKGYYTRRVRKKLLQQSLQVDEIGEHFIEEETEVSPEEEEERVVLLRRYVTKKDPEDTSEAVDEIIDEEEEGFTYMEVEEQSVGEEAVVEVMDESVGEETLMETVDESLGEGQTEVMEESVAETKTDIVEEPKMEAEETEAGSEHVEGELEEEFIESDFTSSYAEQEADESEEYDYSEVVGLENSEEED